MMDRPHIEYIQSQRLPWSSSPDGLQRPGTELKMLSEDAADGACTLLLRYAPQWRSACAVRLEADEEFFVLSGNVRINGTAYAAHDYAFLPEGFGIDEIESDAGATVLEMFSRRPEVTPVAGIPITGDGRVEARLIRRIDPLTMKWDSTGQDAQLVDLQMGRKILRLDPEGRCRTFLLAGLPHSITPARRRPMEYHTYCEEMFLLSGDIACHCGIMRAGAYFWRPPRIAHGLECSRTGFLALLRIPGSNVNVNHWVQEGPVDFAPAYTPFLPPELECYRGTAPEPDVGY